MDFNSFFRGFFRPDNRRGSFESPFPQEPYDPWADNNDEDKENSARSVDPFFDNTSLNIFQHLEDMFNGMFSASFGMIDLPNLETTVSDQISPRDEMLRDSSKCDDSPFCHRSFDVEEREPLVDKDLDDEIAKQGLFGLKKPETFKFGPNKNFSFSKSFSVRTVHLPDGTLEEHRISTDSEGNKVTTVRRHLGDQSHEVTTHSNKHGFQEKEENFINMDERDLSDFERMWQERKGNNFKQTSAIDLPLRKDSASLPVPPGDPAYLSLFKKFFGLGTEK